jgi:hypothetical protein
MCLIEADKKFNPQFTLVNEELNFTVERRLNTL